MSVSAHEGAGQCRFKAALLEHSILPLAWVLLSLERGSNARMFPNYHPPSILKTEPGTAEKPSSSPENQVLILGRRVAPTGWGLSWQSLSDVCETGEARISSLVG